MMPINLYKGHDGLFYPCCESDKLLMQHCVNTDLEALNEKGLEKARYVALAHDWQIRFCAGPKDWINAK